MNEEISFWILSAIAVLGALVAVRKRNLIHGVFALLVFFAGLSGLFLLLLAEFIAAVQVLVYIGAVGVLLLFAIMLSAIYGPSLSNAVAAIAFINAPIFARVARGSSALIWRLDYAMAARAAGRSRAAIALAHVLPNISAVLLVQATIEFAVAILAEAALSYLGLGVQPPTPSWGRMLSEAQTLLFLEPMLAIWPGLCIVVAVIGFNMLGDGLRDATDPRLARAR